MALPESLDWIARLTVLGPIWDQGNHGSCWAVVISSLCDLFYRLFYNYDGNRLLFSPQEIIDFYSREYDLRNGFYAISAALYVIAGGIPLFEHYPYVGVPLARRDRRNVNRAIRRWLRFRRFHVGRYIISDAIVYDSQSIDWNSVDFWERRVPTMIARAPIILCLHAGQAFIQFHADFDEDAFYDRAMEDNIQANNWFYHYVIVYGYNVPNRYFNILNSWGQDWGFNGRARIRFDPDLIERIVEVVPILPQNPHPMRPWEP